MAERDMMFFMTQDEFLACAREVVRQLHLVPFLAAYSANQEIERPVDLQSLAMPNGHTAGMLFFSPEGAEPPGASLKGVIPAMLGWIQCDIPRQSANELTMSRIVAKSDWFDRETMQVKTRRDIFSQFRKIKEIYSEQLKYPVWIVNTKTGKSRIERAIGYSPGAAIWKKGGGKLKQYAVANAEFVIHEPETSGAE